MTFEERVATAVEEIWEIYKKTVDQVDPVPADGQVRYYKPDSEELEKDENGAIVCDQNGHPNVLGAVEETEAEVRARFTAEVTEYLKRRPVVPLYVQKDGGIVVIEDDGWMAWSKSGLLLIQNDD